MRTTQELNRIFKARYRRLVDDSGMKFRELERATGVCKSNLINYYSDERAVSPNAKILTSLCKYFHVSADWLLGISDDGTGEDVGIKVRNREADVEMGCAYYKGQPWLYVLRGVNKKTNREYLATFKSLNAAENFFDVLKLYDECGGNDDG